MKAVLNGKFQILKGDNSALDIRYLTRSNIIPLATDKQSRFYLLLLSLHAFTLLFSIAMMAFFGFISNEKNLKTSKSISTMAAERIKKATSNGISPESKKSIYQYYYSHTSSNKKFTNYLKAFEVLLSIIPHII